MHVVEKSDEGLSRIYAVKVDATELGERLTARIAEITPTLNLKGFRPGKVPPAHVRRVYGKALMGEVVEKTLTETSRQVLEDHKLRIAAQPDLTPLSDMEKVIAGQEDLAYDLSVEVMPDFDPVDVSTLALTRLVYTPSEAEIDEALGELARQNRTFLARKGKAPKAAEGDQVVIDFAGSIAGVPFEGGSARDAEVILGSNQFIPGFESQLVGAAAGADVSVSVSFPEDYAAEPLRGKKAEFAVTVKEVRAPKAAAVDDALGERLGMSDLAALRDAVRGNLQREYEGASRFKLKRALLDALDEAHAIALPPRMVEAEFDSIWRQIEHDKEHGHPAPEDEGKDEAMLRAEYRTISERRVRLGLVLAEIGQRAQVAITEQELNDALRAEAMRYGAQAREVFDFLRQDANAQTQFRAPLYEEKVVDHILGLAKVTDRPVDKEELLADDEPPAAAPKVAKAAKPKKPKAAKAAGTKPAVGEAGEGDAVAPPPIAAAATAKPRPKIRSKAKAQ